MLKKILATCLTISILIPILSACSKPEKKKGTVPTINKQTEKSIVSSTKDSQKNDKKIDDGRKKGEPKYIKLVEPANTKPEKLLPDKGKDFSLMHIANYMSSFLEKLRAGDASVVNYFSYSEVEKDQAVKAYAYRFLPSLFADNEAKDITLEYFNRVKHQIRSSEKNKGEISIEGKRVSEGRIVKRFNAIGISDYGYLATLNTQEFNQIIKPIATEKYINYDIWRPLYDQIVEIINKDNINNYLNISGLELICNADGSLQISAKSFHEGFIYLGLPFVFNKENIQWNFTSVFGYAHKISDEFANSDNKNIKNLIELISIYNSGKYEELYSRMKELCGSDFKLDGYRNVARQLSFHYQEIERRPTLFLDLRFENDATIVGGGLTWGNFIEYKTADFYQFPVFEKAYEYVDLHVNDVEEYSVLHAMQNILSKMLMGAINEYTDRFPDDQFM